MQDLCLRSLSFESLRAESDLGCRWKSSWVVSFVKQVWQHHDALNLGGLYRWSFVGSFFFFFWFNSSSTKLHGPSRKLSRVRFTPCSHRTGTSSGVFGGQELTTNQRILLPRPARVTRKWVANEGRAGPCSLAGCAWAWTPQRGQPWQEVQETQIPCVGGGNRRPHLVSSSALLSALVGLAVITVWS